MAKVRIVYDVDDRQLEAVNKELKEIQRNNNKVEDGFKGTNEEVKKTKTNILDLKGAIANIGLAALAGVALKEFITLNKEIAESRKQVALLTRETGRALDQITAKIRATSKVFDKDFNEVLRAANTLSKEFNVSMTEALDEINEGFTRGLDINGDYLDTLREYSTFIKEAGLNTREFNVLIQQQVRQGIFSDKGIDAIKEAVISIREMTPATRDAIRGIGIDTEKMISDIKAGTTTYFEAVQEIAVKTRELADPVKTGTILADVFRGAGEDAGNFIFTLDQVGNEFAKLTKEEEKYIKTQKDLITANEDLNTAFINLTKSTSGWIKELELLATETAAGTLNFVNDLITGFNASDKAVRGFANDIQFLTVEEQAEELANLEGKLKNLEDRLSPRFNQKLKDFFGLPADFKVAENTPEQIAEINDEIDLLTRKIEVLKQAEIDRAIAAQKASEEVVKAVAKEVKAKQELIDLERIDPTEDPRSQFLQDVEARAERNEIIKNQEEKLNNDLIEINKNRLKEVNDAEEESLLTRAEIFDQFISGAIQIQQGFSNLRIQQINAELASETTSEQRKNELRREQARKEKESALFRIGIETAVNAVKGFPALTAFAIALGAAQAALVLATPVGFKEGVIDLQGPGTSTSDSIPARLSAGESVMTSIETADYKPTLQAIRNREIAPEILNNIALHKDTQPIIIENYDKLAHAVLNQPKKDVIADENGFTGFVFKQGLKLQMKQNKYKM